MRTGYPSPSVAMEAVVCFPLPPPLFSHRFSCNRPYGRSARSLRPLQPPSIEFVADRLRDPLRRQIVHYPSFGAESVDRGVSRSLQFTLDPGADLAPPRYDPTIGKLILFSPFPSPSGSVEWAALISLCLFSPTRGQLLSRPNR